MTKVKLSVSDRAAETYKGDLLVCLAFGDGKKKPVCDAVVKDVISDLYKIGDFKGKNEEQLILYPKHFSRLKKCAAKRLLLAGAGECNDKLEKNEDLEILRCVGGAVAEAAKRIKARDIGVVLPDYLRDRPAAGAEQLIEGILLGNYRFDKYKKKEEEEEQYAGIEKITLYTEGSLNTVRNASKRAQRSAEAALTARNMANEPGNHWTPEQFAGYAMELAGKTDLKCKVLDKSHIKKAGMGGIIAVNQGSAVPPKLILLEYNPKKFTKTILLVGKGITFDSGGVSLKPAAGMQDMKYDMCGAAAVLSAMQAVAEEKPAARVIAVVPSTDNMSGASAVKPGDVIRHYNGVTSEVVNTDAEGRLILADALAYGIDKYKPDCVIDLATLTGAVIIGLGHHRTGLMSNNDKLAEMILEAGDVCGEPLWRLPLGKEYSKQLESDVADIKNVGGKAAGSITAAAYLQKFVEETPWAHLDIAGTAWDFTKKSYIPKGPSGTGVRTLLEFVRNCKSLKLK